MQIQTVGALLHLATEIDPAVEKEFNRWCEGHVTANLALPGFVSARRYVRKRDYAGAGEGPGYLTLYQLDDPGALETEAYTSHDQSVPDEFTPHLSFRRAVYREIGAHAGASSDADARAILHVTVAVDPAHTDAFLQWYADVHVPAVLEVPGMVRARRYADVDLEPGSLPAGAHGYCTIYEMEDAGVMAHPEMAGATSKGACPAALEPHRVAFNHIYEEIYRAP